MEIGVGQFTAFILTFSVWVGKEKFLADDKCQYVKKLFH